MRHPIDAAYLLIAGGFLTAHPSWWNGIAALVWLGAPIARIQREAALLRQDAQYRRYAQQVQRRMLPGVW